jgi:hypothetical protein
VLSIIFIYFVEGKGFQVDQVNLGEFLFHQEDLLLEVVDLS